MANDSINPSVLGNLSSKAPGAEKGGLDNMSMESLGRLENIARFGVGDILKNLILSRLGVGESESTDEDKPKEDINQRINKRLEKEYKRRLKKKAIKDDALKSKQN